MTDEPTVPLERLLQQWGARVEDVDHALAAAEHSRSSLLYVHASAGLFIAPLFLQWASRPASLASPTWVVARNIPLASVTLSVLLFAGATLLMMGTAGRRLRLARIGLVLMCGFYTLIAVTFGASVVVWLVGGAHPVAEPAVYTPFVYGHLATVLAIHTATVRSMVQERVVR